MYAIDPIRWSLQMTRDFTVRITSDLRAHPLLQPAPGKGNHPVWLLGHLATIEASVPNVLVGEPNPREGWWPLFAPGTQPLLEAAKYPSFDELLSTFRDRREYNLALLDRLGDAALDRRPENVPPGFEDAMKTVGQTFLLIALHNMQHAGQLAGCRRAAGLRPHM